MNMFSIVLDEIPKKSTITSKVNLSAIKSGEGRPVVGFVPPCFMVSRRLNIDSQRKCGLVDWKEREHIDIPKWLFDGRGPE